MRNKGNLFRITLVAVIIAGGIAWFGGALHNSNSNRVYAMFASAAPLVDGNQVKVGGVVVGKVTDMKVVNGVAKVGMEIDKSALPLHTDATMTIRPVSLLGERYVDLVRGTPTAPVLNNDAVLPLSHTATSVGLDQVLNTVDQPSGAGLRGLVTTLGEGMQGNGQNVNAAIQALAPTMTNARAMAQVLSQQNQMLGQLVDDFQPVASALAVRDGNAMDQLVGSSEQVMAAVRRRQVELDQTLLKLPETLRLLRSTLTNLDQTAASTTPTLQSLRPLMDNLPAISTEVQNFANALDPALVTSQPVLDRAYALLKQAEPVSASLRQSGSGLATAVHGTTGVVNELTQNRDNLLAYVRNWALTTNGFDGLSHYFRVNATINPATLTGLFPSLTSKTGARGGKGATGLLNGLNGLTNNGLTKSLTGTLSGLLPLLGGPPKSPTGLTPKQQSNLLSALLGGN
ncbi:MAG TPA: MlaD family protein [Marmoricola sp.]|nr:MlaD family protein [Marmoricola sp.]